MAASSLSRRDFNVLEKIKDPESNPFTAILVDPTLPKDPVITDTSIYERISQKEREIISSMKDLEMQLAGLKSASATEPVKAYQECVSSLGQLITEYPKYASARNNRAQALRRLYGNAMLLSKASDPGALVEKAESATRSSAASTALSDLDEAIRLLTPRSPFNPISSQASKTLSLAHTQRAAIYHETAKRMDLEEEIHIVGRKESSWSRLDFEGAASRDFALGGRYGNDIAKGLAVSTNPTAKLCGQMVQEAMKKEYGAGFEP
jgi:hypothetical protein